MPLLENFIDHKCAWGYITLCPKCITHAPKHVDVSTSPSTRFPTPKCELCGKTEKQLQREHHEKN